MLEVRRRDVGRSRAKPGTDRTRLWNPPAKDKRQCTKAERQADKEEAPVQYRKKELQIHQHLAQVRL